MSTQEEYRLLAQRCVRMAAQTTDDRERQTLQEMADACSCIAELCRDAKEQLALETMSHA